MLSRTPSATRRSLNVTVSRVSIRISLRRRAAAEDVDDIARRSSAACQRTGSPLTGRVARQRGTAARALHRAARAVAIDRRREPYPAPGSGPARRQVGHPATDAARPRFAPRFEISIASRRRRRTIALTSQHRHLLRLDWGRRDGPGRTARRSVATIALSEPHAGSAAGPARTWPRKKKPPPGRPFAARIPRDRRCAHRLSRPRRRERGSREGLQNRGCA